MKRLFTLSIALLFAATAFAQLSAVSGQPMPKKGAEPIVDALVTFTSEWDKDLKYQRKTDADGFRVVLPQGGYLLTIEAAGYETYRLEIEVDEPNINLDVITMLTVEQATERDAKRKKRAARY
jgi:hypothetical protein